MWNYRVVRRKHLWRDPQTHQERVTYSYGIHEAYYDQGGHVGMITQDAMEPHGDTVYITWHEQREDGQTP